MKKAFLFAGALLLISSSVMAMRVPAVWTAKHATVDYIGHNSYYSCDYMERVVKQDLQKLGARQVTTTCTGGVPYSPFVEVWARFWSATSATSATNGGTVEPADFTYTEFQSWNDSCDANREVIRQLLPYFEAQGVSDKSSCWDSQGTLKYSASVLK